jgi:ATP-dependent DNA ligase
VRRRPGVALLSRRKKVLNRGSSSVVEALASLGSDFVLDGELVALDSQGRPSFQLVAKVKNGFVSRIRKELFPVLKALQTAQCPMPRHRWTFSPPWGMEDLK